MPKLFVYGTLMDRMEQIAPGSKLLSEAPIQLRNYDMFDLGWFPGVMRSPWNGRAIQGLIYQVPDFDNADRYEGYDVNNLNQSLYIRNRIPADSLPGDMDKQQIYIYEYNGHPSREQIIADGVWKRE